MRICVVGAGAIGGFLGVKLALSGQNMTFIDQGEHLLAMQKKGLRLITQEGIEHLVTEARFTARFEDAGAQDYIILAVKAHQIAEVARRLPSLFDEKTAVVTVQNGIPWWYFKKYGGTFKGKRLESLDPTGVIESNIEADRVIGCIAYPAAAVVEPGVVRQVEGNRFSVGELDNTKSPRCLRLQQALVDSGFKSYILDDLRGETWLKAWGNLSFNPISALTHATLVDICQFTETRALAAAMMREAQEIAGKLGVTFRHTIERRIEGTEAVGAHKTSMLQDVESGRSLELEALVGAILEIGRMTKTPAPATETVYACTKLLNKTFVESRSCIKLVPGE